MTSAASSTQELSHRRVNSYARGLELTPGGGKPYNFWTTR
jgi:hypothetical protein